MKKTFSRRSREKVPSLGEADEGVSDELGFEPSLRPPSPSPALKRRVPSLSRKMR